MGNVKNIGIEFVDSILSQNKRFYYFSKFYTSRVGAIEVAFRVDMIRAR